MTDLPERLRALADSLEGDDWNHPLLSRDACREAASEIERLRAEIDRMRPELIRLRLSAQRRDCERSDCRPDERDMM